MQTNPIDSIDIRIPEFKILLHKNVMVMERDAAKLYKDGWYPVGNVGRKGNNWVQVIVREKMK